MVKWVVSKCSEQSLIVFCGSACRRKTGRTWRHDRTRTTSAPGRCRCSGAPAAGRRAACFRRPGARQAEGARREYPVARAARLRERAQVGGDCRIAGMLLSKEVDEPRPARYRHSDRSAPSRRYNATRENPKSRTQLPGFPSRMSRATRRTNSGEMPIYAHSPGTSPPIADCQQYMNAHNGC